jgi:hypothetical protein
MELTPGKYSLCYLFRQEFSVQNANKIGLPPFIRTHTQMRRYNVKIKLRGFRPQANYTDRATAACRRS